MSLDLRYEVQLRLYLLGPPRSDLQMRATREYTACNEEDGEKMVNESGYGGGISLLSRLALVCLQCVVTLLVS